jgi:hypothetical protein
MSPRVLTVAKPDRAETSNIAALTGFADIWIDACLSTIQVEPMKSLMISACIALVLFAHPATADEELPTPHVIACLKAIEPLDLRYRGWMQRQCVGVAGDICVAIDRGTGTCLPELVGSMREFYATLSPLLPNTIEGSGFQVRGYERALERAADTFENVPECAELDGYEFTTCEYIQLGVATTDLFYRARQAEVSLP